MRSANVVNAGRIHFDGVTGTIALMTMLFIVSATGHVPIGHPGGAFGRTHFVSSAAGTAAGARTAGEGDGGENGEAQRGDCGF